MDTPTCPTCGHPDKHSPLSGCLHTDGETYCTCTAAWTAPKSLDDARRERDEGMAHAAQGTDPAWEAAAVDAIRSLAATASVQALGFTTDDVWDLLAERGAPECREPRAIGPLIQAAVREGIITRVEGYRPSRRRHCTPLPIWRGTL